MQRLVIPTGIAISVLLGCLIIFGPQPKTYTIEKNEIVIQSLKSFSEEGLNVGFDPKILIEKYNSTRKAALEKSNHLIKQRNWLILAFHILCIGSIIASFILSYIGATKGIVVTSDTVTASLASAKRADLRFKKRIILISAISILFTTLSNRFSVYADQSENKADEIIAIVKSVDSKVTSSISIKDAQESINAFELDISKY